jgi:Rieske 2Fe-2S protein
LRRDDVAKAFGPATCDAGDWNRRYANAGKWQEDTREAAGELALAAAAHGLGVNQMKLMCGTVQCPWHGSQFDVRTGEVKCGPAEKDIRTYPIEEQPAKTA